MTPEELNSAHREFVVGQLSRHANLLHKLFNDDDPGQLTKYILERGTTLAEHQLLPESEVLRVNRLFVALYKNVELEEWQIQWSDTLNRDTRAAHIIQTMNMAPASVSAEDYRYIYDNFATEEAVILPAIEIMLRDPDIRAAMDLEDGITVDEFRRRSVERGDRALTYEEFQNTAGQYGYFGPFQCGWTVCLFVFIFLSQIISPGVTCTSGSSAASTLAGMVPNDEPMLCSDCTNASSRTIWLAVRGFSGFRRVALAPGRASSDLGLNRVEALIVGGRGNELTRLRMPDGQVVESGCYVLFCDGAAPGSITISDDHEGAVSVVANESQRDAVARGAAGYSPIDGDATAPYANPRYAMDRAALLLPPSVEPERYSRSLDAAHNYSRILNMTNYVAAVRALNA